MAEPRPIDYPGELLAACCDSALHIWRPKNGGDGEDKVVPSDRTVLAAAWNRNNKVVACSSEDGTIELRYSNGALMTTLARGTAVPGAARPAASLAWSMGSKRLAAAAPDGAVYIHDMTAKVGSSFLALFHLNIIISHLHLHLHLYLYLHTHRHVRRW